MEGKDLIPVKKCSCGLMSGEPYMLWVTRDTYNLSSTPKRKHQPQHRTRAEAIVVGVDPYRAIITSSSQFGRDWRGSNNNDNSCKEPPGDVSAPFGSREREFFVDDLLFLLPPTPHARRGESRRDGPVSRNHHFFFAIWTGLARLKQYDMSYAGAPRDVSAPYWFREREREFFIADILVRIHFIILMMRWTGLAP